MLFSTILISGCSKNTLPAGITHINPPGDVCAMVLDGDILWAGGKSGVVKIDRKSGKVSETIIHEPEYSYIRSLALDKKGRLWIGHIHGLICFENNKITKDLTARLPDPRVNVVYIDSKDRLWIGTWGGVVIVDGSELVTLTTEDGLIHNMVNTITEDSSGRMWLGSYVAPEGGLTVIDDGKYMTLDVERGLPHANVTSMAEVENGMWIGTGLFYTGGAVLVDVESGELKVRKSLGKTDGLPGEKVRSIFRDSNDNIWFGSEYDGVARFTKNGSRTLFTLVNGLCNMEVKCIVEDIDGVLWIGTRDGITKIGEQYGQKGQ